MWPYIVKHCFSITEKYGNRVVLMGYYLYYVWGELHNYMHLLLHKWRYFLERKIILGKVPIFHQFLFVNFSPGQNKF